MDVVVAIVAGLSSRLFLNNVDDPLRALTPAILGLCEGAIVRYLSNRTSSVDHYLAYGLRIVVDLLFTQNITRMLLVLLWTVIFVIALEAISPTPRRRETKRSRRSAHPATIHTSRPQQLANTPPSHPPLTHTPPYYSQNDLNSISTPALQHPSRPPSPPSFFLEGDTDTNIISPLSEQQLEYVPEPNSPTYASSSGVAPLSTPPGMQVIDAQESDHTLSHHRLSTIQELSSDETTNVDRTDQRVEPDRARTPGIHTTYDKANTSYAHSIATSAPLPVPNATYIRPPYRNIPDDDHPNSLNSSPDSVLSAPLPVPNAALRSQLSSGWNAGAASETDELRTPGAHYWELTDQDELRTPPGGQKELSPLFPDQQLPAGFNVTPEIPPAVDEISLSLIPVVDHGINLPSSAITAISTLVNSSVECFPKVVNDQDPDLDKLSESETLQTENAESVMSPVGNSVEQFSRGQFFRQEAWQEEKQRIDLENKLKAALREARIRDALFLREEIRVLEERTKKLHEKAARRFFKGVYVCSTVEGSVNHLT